MMIMSMMMMKMTTMTTMPYATTMMVMMISMTMTLLRCCLGVFFPDFVNETKDIGDLADCSGATDGRTEDRHDEL